MSIVNNSGCFKCRKWLQSPNQIQHDTAAVNDAMTVTRVLWQTSTRHPDRSRQQTPTHHPGWRQDRAADQIPDSAIITTVITWGWCRGNVQSMQTLTCKGDQIWWWKYIEHWKRARLIFVMGPVPNAVIFIHMYVKNVIFSAALNCIPLSTCLFTFQLHILH